MIQKNINPITRLDYPDPDIIRVGDTYYMVSTTMYFMPGCEILRSYDLVHWEHATFVYDRLDSTPAQRLEGKDNIYGQGMWAASLRYHEGIFYICFVANDTHKTYIYQSKDINGPWEKYTLEGFYHDNSILFDDDGRVFIVSGNKEIHIKELKLVSKDLSGITNNATSNIPTVLTDKIDGGLDMTIVQDSNDVYLGYEGAHFYKINGKYYLFFIHMPKSTGKRTEAVFVADKPEGPYVGRDVMDDDRGYRGSGVAQGGIVETPSGKWYSILFQDSGAVGRIPVLMPVTWGKDGFPVFGDKGKIPEEFEIEDLRPGYEYTPLVGSDDFKDELHEDNRDSIVNAPADDSKMAGSFGFKPCWQFNHEPDMSLIKRDLEMGTVTITTDKLCTNLVQAKNTLTQRTLFPGCSCSVKLDGSLLRDGDYAGLCILESNYGLVGITRKEGDFFLVMGKREITTGGFWGERHDDEPFEEVERIKLNSPVVTLSASICYDKGAVLAKAKEKESSEYAIPQSTSIAKANFGKLAPLPEEDDTAVFYYNEEQIGEAFKLKFMLDHFTGARFGLFVYSTMEAGGGATFSNFVYITKK
ncbi:glycoside hydrolase family 43 protein [Butyrivibrio sp. INlla14]|uniref:glycoside hydrolase family 43 protein n=1 Tax=Butyrivibrio sp. INlla14 TaxID=1520808 RepID=UPI0008772753|nr:glycoside hydrolase 43 family protein [Butyrivibrio sp. INlla14]SCY61711.1 Beta-xylosidase [Butyrivibrio sp. INlla14]